MQNTTETTTQQQTTQAPTQAKDPGELSFTEYQAYRRTGEMPKAEVTPVDEKKSASAESTPAAQKEATASGTEATEDKEETGNESEAEGDEPKAAEESAKDDKPKKKGGFQRRIDKLNAQKTQAQQEIEYWKKLALESAGSKTESPAAKVETPATATDGKPSPDKYETHAEYVEALTDWKLEQRLKEREAKQEQAKVMSEQEKLVQTYAEKAKTFAEKTEDFQDTLEAVDHIPLSPAVQRLILKSGPELAYALAKDPEEYARINRLSPIDAAEAVGELKARLVSSKAPEAKTETKKLTQAPNPIEPVSGGQAKVAKSLDDPNLSFTDYVKLRREQAKQKRA